MFKPTRLSATMQVTALRRRKEGLREARSLRSLVLPYCLLRPASQNSYPAGHPPLPWPGWPCSLIPSFLLRLAAFQRTRSAKIVQTLYTSKLHATNDQAYTKIKCARSVAFLQTLYISHDYKGASAPWRSVKNLTLSFCARARGLPVLRGRV